jgi:hypothetical protein
VVIDGIIQPYPPHNMKLSPGGELLFKQAVKKLETVFGRPLTGEQKQQLAQEVGALSAPKNPVRTSLTPPQAARNRYELASNPQLINPDTARDEFLLHATLGRGGKGTRNEAMTVDINSPEIGMQMEKMQQAGALEKLGIPNATLTPSTTPGADYLANMSELKQNFVLQNSGMYDQLKDSFKKQYKRYPTQEEMEQVIAAYNPLRHQYGEKGKSIVTERPGSAKGMEEYRANARLEGVPESYLYHRPGNYRQELLNELDIAQGITPATKTVEQRAPRARDIDPTDSYYDPDSGAFVSVYPTMKAAGGSIHPDSMMAEMNAYGYTPQKYAKGKSVAMQYAPAALMAEDIIPRIGSMSKNASNKKYGDLTGDVGSFLWDYVVPTTMKTTGLGMALASPNVGEGSDMTPAKQEEAMRQEMIQRQYQDALKKAKKTYGSAFDYMANE